MQKSKVNKKIIYISLTILVTTLLILGFIYCYIPRNLFKGYLISSSIEESKENGVFLNSYKINFIPDSIFTGEIKDEVIIKEIFAERLWSHGYFYTTKIDKKNMNLCQLVFTIDTLTSTFSYDYDFVFCDSIRNCRGIGSQVIATDIFPRSMLKDTMIVKIGRSRLLSDGLNLGKLELIKNE